MNKREQNGGQNNEGDLIDNSGTEPTPSADIPYLPEPTRALQPIIDVLQVSVHPSHWGKVLRVACDGGKRVLVPAFYEMQEDEALPANTAMPVSQQAIQRLFDSLWMDGLRPTGFTVILEAPPSMEYPQALKEEMYEICQELAESTGKHHFFETTSSGYSMIFKESEHEGADADTEEEFENVDEVLHWLLQYRIECPAAPPAKTVTPTRSAAPIKPESES